MHRTLKIFYVKNLSSMFVHYSTLFYFVVTLDSFKRLSSSHRQISSTQRLSLFMYILTSNQTPTRCKSKRECNETHDIVKFISTFSFNVFLHCFHQKYFLYCSQNHFQAGKLTELDVKSSGLHVNIIFWYLPESIEKIYLCLNDRHTFNRTYIMQSYYL